MDWVELGKIYFVVVVDVLRVGVVCCYRLSHHFFRQGRIGIEEKCTSNGNLLRAYRWHTRTGTRTGTQTEYRPVDRLVDRLVADSLTNQLTDWMTDSAVALAQHFHNRTNRLVFHSRSSTDSTE